MWWPYIKCPFTAVTLTSLLPLNSNYNSPWVETLQNKTFLKRTNFNFIFIVLIDFKSAALKLHEKSFGWLTSWKKPILLQARLYINNYHYNAIGSQQGIIWQYSSLKMSLEPYSQSYGYKVVPYTLQEMCY